MARTTDKYPKGPTGPDSKNERFSDGAEMFQKALENAKPIMEDTLKKLKHKGET